jgi:hypothetical protein
MCISSEKWWFSSFPSSEVVFFLGICFFVFSSSDGAKDAWWDWHDLGTGGVCGLWLIFS